MNHESLRGLIEQAFEDRAALSPAAAPTELRGAVEAVLDGLEDGSLRVDDFLLNEEGTDERFLAWKSLSAKGIAFDLSPRRLHIQDVRFQLCAGRAGDPRHALHAQSR